MVLKTYHIVAHLKSPDNLADHHISVADLCTPRSHSNTPAVDIPEELCLQR